MIEWANVGNSSTPGMLTANDREIKLWRLGLKKEKKYESCKKMLSKGKLQIPRSKLLGESVEGTCKRLYKGAHDFHINSVSLNPDGETFLSVDDLRINLWNLQDANEVYNVLDIKPKSINDIEEAITSAEFHPHQSSLFNYTTSKGVLALCDFRDKSSF